eukprot:m.68234 g.68234  ORF g.68234 m.68234 type:complete len:654 (-) comp11950_c0_seq2:250-2211(-)
MAAVDEGQNEGPYRNQSKLERLPVPSLEDTLNTYLKWLRPVVTDEEFEEAKIAVEEFKDNQGPNLQDALVEYDKSTTFKSYIEEFWNDSYLVPEGSVVLSLNPFFVLEDDPTPNRNSQIPRAASLVFSMLKFVSCLRQGKTTPDILKDGRPLCMSQYKRMFSTARLPREGRDEIQVDDNGRNVVVLCRNMFYSFEALWPNFDVCVSEADLRLNFEAILADGSDISAKERAECAMGVFTTANRRHWAKMREKISQVSERNRKNLQVIDSSLFVICLDTEDACSTLDQVAANMLHGTYRLDSAGIQTGTLGNRWYDKFQIIVTENGHAGINFEHTAVDGHTMLRVVSDVFADTVVRFAQSITATTHGRGYLSDIIPAKFRSSGNNDGGDKGRNRSNSVSKNISTIPRKLSFDLHGLTRDIYFAETKVSDLVTQSTTSVLEYDGFGKSWITRNNCSPDAFVQLSMMMAYYLLYGSFPSTYESVQMKTFLHGRTEAGRSCTAEFKVFAESFASDACSLEEKRELFSKAIVAHSTMTKICSCGQGIDRHMFGLQSMCTRLGVPVPKLFSTPAHKKFNTILLSTSNCGNPSLRLFGFGPVADGGFGIGYIIKENGLHYCVSAKQRQTERYVRMLKQYLDSMEALLENTRSVEVIRDTKD